MADVNGFERRRRFKNYLTKEDASTELPIRLARPPPQNSQGSEHCGLERAQQAVTPKSLETTDLCEDIKLLSCAPRRPPKTNESTGNDDVNESSSLMGPHVTTDVNMPITLPPPFSLERRVVSDIQSLPSGRISTPARTRRGSMRQELPVTPTRQPPSTASAEATPDQQTQSGGSRIFSSAARFIGSIVRFPRHHSPSSPPRMARTTFAVRSDRDEPGSSTPGSPRVRVYDDSLPASAQPQTPLNLPEARHRSRLYGFHTVPARPRTARRPIQRFAASQSGPDDVHIPSVPVGPGFRDLYREIDELNGTESPNGTSEL